MDDKTEVKPLSPQVMHGAPWTLIAEALHKATGVLQAL
jgi:hypothetical protein